VQWARRKNEEASFSTYRIFIWFLIIVIQVSITSLYFTVGAVIGVLIEAGKHGGKHTNLLG
jgi:hypothetical protein